MEGFEFTKIIFLAITSMLGIFTLVFWIKNLIQCIRSDTDNSSKLKWVILMWLIGFLGSLFCDLFGAMGRAEKEIS